MAGDSPAGRSKPRNPQQVVVREIQEELDATVRVREPDRHHRFTITRHSIYPWIVSGVRLRQEGAGHLRRKPPGG